MKKLHGESKKIIASTIKNCNYESIYYLKSFLFSEDAIQFVLKNVDQLSLILTCNDFLSTKNTDDSLDLYIGVKNNDDLEMILISSPFEFFAPDTVMICKIKNITKTRLLKDSSDPYNIILKE